MKQFCLPFFQDILREIFELQDGFHLFLLVKIVIFYDQIMVLEQLDDSGEAFFKVSCHMIEVDLDLKLGLNQKQEMPEELFHLPSNISSGTLSMYPCQINTDIGLVSLFIHCLSDKGHLFDELSDLIVKFLYIFRFDRQNDKTVESLLKDSDWFSPEDSMSRVKNNKSIILTEFNLNLILRLYDRYLLLQGFLDDCFNGEGLFLIDAFMEQVEDGDVELRYLLDYWHHLRDIKSHGEKDCQLVSGHSFEPYVYPTVTQLFPEHEGLIDNEDEIRLMAVEDPQATVHVHQSRPAHYVEFSFLTHEDVQSMTIGRDLNIVFFLHPIELIPVDLHEEPSPNGIITPKVHDELEGIAGGSLEVVLGLDLHALVFGGFIGVVLQRPLIFEVGELVLLHEGGFEFVVLDVGILEDAYEFPAAVLVLHLVGAGVDVPVV